MTILWLLFFSSSAVEMLFLEHPCLPPCKGLNSGTCNQKIELKKALGWGGLLPSTKALRGFYHLYPYLHKAVVLDLFFDQLTLIQNVRSSLVSILSVKNNFKPPETLAVGDPLYSISLFWDSTEITLNNHSQNKNLTYNLFHLSKNILGEDTCRIGNNICDRNTV